MHTKRVLFIANKKTMWLVSINIIFILIWFHASISVLGVLFLWEVSGSTKLARTIKKMCAESQGSDFSSLAAHRVLSTRA